MNLLSHKLYFLGASILLSLLAAGWLWRKRGALAAAPLSRSHAGLAVAGVCVLMLALSWRNGVSIYMADESMYLLGASNFTAGMWVDEAPPTTTLNGTALPVAYLPIYLVKVGTSIFPIYPLGWPAILAGLRQVVPGPYTGPVLGMLILLITGHYCRRYLPEGTADGAMWVMALSASYFLNCLGFMSHAPTAVLMMLGAVYLEKSLETGRRVDMLLAALLCGATLVVRPLTGLLALLAAGLTFWWRFGFRRALAAAAPGGLLAAGLLSLQNANTTGLWYRSGYTQYIIDNNLIAFGGPEVLILQVRRFADTVACSHPLLLALMLAACLHPGTRKRSLWYLAFFSVIVLAHGVLMPVDSDSPIGERYFFEGMILVFVVAGMGWAAVSGLLGERRWLLPVFSVLAAAYPIWHLAEVHHNLRTLHAFVLEQKEELGKDAELVYFDTTLELPARNYWLNPPHWRAAKTVFLPTPPPEHRAALAEAMGRPRWKLVGLAAGERRFVELERSR